MKCKSIQAPEFKELRSVVISHKRAQLMFQLNNDFNMDFTPTGEPSMLVKQMTELFGRDAALYAKYLAFLPIREGKSSRSVYLSKSDRNAQIAEIESLSIRQNILGKEHPVYTSQGQPYQSYYLGLPEYTIAAVERSDKSLTDIIRTLLHVMGGIEYVGSDNVKDLGVVQEMNNALNFLYDSTVPIPKTDRLFVTMGKNGMLEFDYTKLRSIQYYRAARWAEYVIERGKKDTVEGLNATMDIMSGLPNDAVADASIDWFAKAYPQVSVNVAALGENIDAFLNAALTKVTLSSRNTDFTQLYHEGFHRISLGFLNEDERQSMYKELRNRLGTKKVSVGVRGVRKMIQGNQLTAEEAEEYLAEQFRQYMLLGKTFNFPPKAKLQKSFFEMIMDILAKWLGRSTKGSEFTIEEMFSIVQNGNGERIANRILKPARLGLNATVDGMNEMQSQSYIQDLNTRMFTALFSDQTYKSILKDLLLGRVTSLDTLYREFVDVSNPLLYASVKRAHAVYMKEVYDVDVSQIKYEFEKVDYEEFTDEETESEEARSTVSQTFSEKSEKSIIKKLANHLRLIFSGIHAGGYDTAEVNFKDISTTVMDISSGHKRLDLLYKALLKASTVKPELAVLVQRLQYIDSLSSDPFFASYGRQLHTLFNKHTTSFGAQDKQGNIVDTLDIIQQTAEITKWRSNFISNAKYMTSTGVVYLTKNGILNIEELQMALHNIIRSANPTRSFSELTGIELGAARFLSINTIIDDYSRIVAGLSMTGDVLASDVFDEIKKTKFFDNVFNYKIDVMRTSVINKDMSISKNTRLGKRVYSIGEPTGLNHIIDEIETFFFNYYLDNDLGFDEKIELFHSILSENGFVMPDSTPGKIILQPYLHSSLVLQQMIAFATNPNLSFTGNTIHIKETVLTGVEDRLGTVGVEYGKLQHKEMIKMQLNVLLKGMSIMVRPGERERESALTTTIVSGDSLSRSKSPTAQTDIIENFIRTIAVKDIPQVDSMFGAQQRMDTGYKRAYTEYVYTQFKDELRRMFYLNGKHESQLSISALKNRSRYITLDKFVAKQVYNKQNNTLTYITDTTQSSYPFIIDPAFIIPESVFEQYRDSIIANPNDTHAILEAFVDAAFKQAQSKLSVNIDNIFKSDIDLFFKLLTELNIVRDARFSNGSYMAILEFNGDATGLLKLLSNINEDSVYYEKGKQFINLSEVNLKEYLAYIHTKYYIGLNEGAKLTVGDLSNFTKISEIYRRLETIGSTFTKTPSFINTAAYPRIDGRMDTKLRFHVYNDMETNHEDMKSNEFFDEYRSKVMPTLHPDARVAFSKMIDKRKKAYEKKAQTTDAQFVVTPVFYRDILSKQVIWSDEQEQWYQAQMGMAYIKAIEYNQSAENTEKIMFRGSELTVEYANVYLMGEGFSISPDLEVLKNNKSIAWSKTKFRPKPAKPKGSGLQNIVKYDRTVDPAGIRVDAGYATYFMLKTSMTPLTPSSFSTDAQLLEFFEMLNNGVDGKGFSSAFKDTIPTTDKMDDDTLAAIFEIEMSNMGMQLIEEGKERKDIIISKQMLTDAIKDIKGNPYLSEATRERMNELDNRKQELFEALLQTNTYTKFMKMGVFFDVFNEKIFVFDNKKFSETLAKRAENGRLSAQEAAVIEEVVGRNEFIEVTKASSLIQNLMSSVFKESAINVESPGTMLIQESDVALGEKLPFYRYENGKLKKPGVKVPLPSRYYKWVLANFMPEGSTSEYRAFEEFKKAFKDKTHPKAHLIKAELRKALVNRTPLDNRHSVTAVDIVDYYMPYEKYAIMIPSELVIPYGFDFDYDKLTVYQYSPEFKKGKSSYTLQFSRVPQRFASNPSGETSIGLLRDLMTNNTNGYLQVVDQLLTHMLHSGEQYQLTVKAIIGRLQKLASDFDARRAEIGKLSMSHRNDLRNAKKELLKISESGEFNSKFGEILLEKEILENMLGNGAVTKLYQEAVDKMVSESAVILDALFKNTDFKFPLQLFYGRTKIANGLLDSLYSLYAEEEFLYSALNPTSTASITDTAIQLMGKNNPDVDQWYRIQDPVSNMRTGKVTLSGGASVGILASTIHIINIAQKIEQGLIIDMPIGLLFDGYNPLEKMQIGYKIQDSDGNFISDSESELAAASLDLAKSLVVFYAGFNEEVASVMSFLMAASTKSNFAIPLRLIQQLYATHGIRNVYRSARTYMQDNQTYGLAATMLDRNVQLDALKTIESQLHSYIKSLYDNDAAGNKAASVVNLAAAGLQQPSTLAYDIIQYIRKKRKNVDGVNNRELLELEAMIQSKANRPNVLVTVDEMTRASMPIGEFVDMVFAKSKDVNVQKAMFVSYFKAQKKLMDTAAMYHAMSQLFSEISINYRLISYKGRGFNDMLQLQSNMHRIEDPNTGLIGNILAFKNETFVGTLDSAIKVFYKFQQGMSFFAQAFADEKNAGLKILNEFLPFNHQLSYTEMEDAFKSFAVLSNMSGVFKDGVELTNSDYVQELLSVDSTIPNIKILYETLQDAIASDPVLESRYAKNKLFQMLSISNGYQKQNGFTNPNMISVATTVRFMEPADAYTISNTIKSMRSERVLEHPLNNFLSALALVNMAINPMKSYAALGQIVELEYAKYARAALQTLVTKGALDKNDDFNKQLAYEFIMSLILNNPDNPNIVTNVLGKNLLDFASFDDIYDDSADSPVYNLPQTLDSRDIDSFPYLKGKQFLAFKVDFVDPEIAAANRYPMKISLVYERVTGTNQYGEYEQHYALMGASGIRGELFLPVTPTQSGFVIQTKLTPWLEMDALNAGVHAAQQNKITKDEYGSDFTNRAIRTYPPFFMDSTLLKAYVSASDKQYKGIFLFEDNGTVSQAGDIEQNFADIIGNHGGYMRLTDNSSLKAHIMRVTNARIITSLEEWYDNMNLEGTRRNLEGVLLHAPLNLHEELTRIHDLLTRAKEGGFDGFIETAPRIVSIDMQNTRKTRTYTTMVDARTVTGMDMFNLGTTDVVRSVDDRIQSKLKMFFQGLGFTTERVDKVLGDFTNQGIAPRAVVNVLNKTLQHIEEDSLDIADIPEEAAHVFLAMYGDRPLVRQMRKQIANYAAYEEVMHDKDKYPKGTDFELEAIAKVLGRAMVNNILGEVVYPVEPEADGFFARIWKWLTNLFTNTSTKNALLNEMNAFVDDVVSKQEEQQENEEEYVKPDDVTISSLPARLQEVVIKKNAVTNQNELLNNHASSIPLDQFDSFFPDYSYLTDEQKLAFVYLADKGYLELSCKI